MSDTTTHPEDTQRMIVFIVKTTDDNPSAQPFVKADKLAPSITDDRFARIMLRAGAEALRLDDDGNVCSEQPDVVSVLVVADLSKWPGPRPQPVIYLDSKEAIVLASFADALGLTEESAS